MKYRIYTDGAYNRTELKDIINAVLQLPHDATDIVVYSDSMYTLYTLSGKWERKLNKDLFDVWDNVIKERSLTVEYDAIGYDANEEKNIFKKDNQMEETVSISKQRYEFLLRCEELIRNNI